MARVLSAARLKELISKYGKVALIVHFSVSTFSIGGLYVAIKNNVDVKHVLERVGLVADRVEDGDVQAGGPREGMQGSQDIVLGDVENGGHRPDSQASGPEQRKPVTDLLYSGGGALALAILCNKALLPVRVPITFALTPPVARFLARRNLFKMGD